MARSYIEDMEQGHQCVHARAFLLNISLDGSHKDTIYGKLKLVKPLSEILKKEVNMNQRSQLTKDDNSKEKKKDICADEFNLPAEPHFKKSFKLNNIDKAETRLSKGDYELNVSNESEETNTRKLYTSVSICEDPSSQLALPAELEVAISDTSISLKGGPKLMQTKSVPCPSVLRSSNHSLYHKKSRLSNYFKKRVMLLSSKRAPLVIFSNIPYKSPSLSSTLKIHTGPIATGDLASTIIEHAKSEHEHEWISYSHLLVPSKPTITRSLMLFTEAPSTHSSPGKACMLKRDLLPFKRTLSTSMHHSPQKRLLDFHNNFVDNLAGSTEEIIYHPNLLDDPELRSGKHRTLLYLPSYMTSVIDYTRPSDLKKELNEKFKVKFPHIELTLSKLRSLKNDMKKIAYVKCGLDLWDVAQSYVYFEKVILKGYLTKPRRKHIACACLLLSAKLNDIKKPELSKLIQEIEDTFKLCRSTMVYYEFEVLVQLEFSLLVPYSEVNPHYQRLIYST